MTMTEWKEKTADIMEGSLTLTKIDFLLIAAVMLLAGICIGFLTAPFTHGVSICSNNGSGSAGHADDGGRRRS